MTAVFDENIFTMHKLASNNYFGKNIRVVGLPSEDGSGPSACINSSFSITAGTPLEKGCYDFLEILLSDDVQKKTTSPISVNRAAVKFKLEREAEDNRIGYEQLMRRRMPGISDIPLDEAFRNQLIYDPDIKLDIIFLEMLETVDSILTSDNSVLIIISEEIPPYLIGQKDLDSVIPAIKSRTQLVYKER